MILNPECTQNRLTPKLCLDLLKKLTALPRSLVEFRGEPRTEKGHKGKGREESRKEGKNGRKRVREEGREETTFHTGTSFFPLPALNLPYNSMLDQLLPTNMTTGTEVRSASFTPVLHAHHIFANSFNFYSSPEGITIFHSTCIFCVYRMALSRPPVLS